MLLNVRTLVCVGFGLLTIAIATMINVITITIITITIMTNPITITTTQ